jgi:cytochrome c553
MLNPDLLMRTSFFIFLSAFSLSHAQIILPSIESSQLAPELKGRVLIEELNCVACHQADDTLASASRKSPRLSAVGSRVNPDYLRKFIASPHKTKPGTTMPGLSDSLSQQDKESIANEITHFLVSLNKAHVFKQEAPDFVAAAKGNELFHSVGCVACHSPRDPDGKELLLSSSVPLGNLSEKYSHKSLREFLQRPHSVRPSGRMPDLRIPGQDLDRITHYLLKNTRIPGHLAYTTWRGKVWEGLKGDVEPEKAGQTNDLSLTPFQGGNGKVPQHTAIRFNGFLRINTPGTYTFHLEMNGGSLLLNEKEILNEAPSDRRGVKKLTGTANLKQGWNPIEFTYFQTGRNANLKFEMEGPGFKRQTIPPSLFATSDQPIPVVKPLKVDQALAAKGKAHFVNFGCVKCHDDIKVTSSDYPALSALKSDKGCLSHGSSAPHFDLTPEQEKLIAHALPKAGSVTFTDHQLVNKTLTTFNCIACHDREGLGGISPERNPYFTGTSEALGDQGRLPPPLTHVGAKLTKSWLKEILVHGGRQREYLNTRMPLFSEANVGHLVEGFGKVDSLEEATLPKVVNIRESKNAGYEMTGAGGLSCIACHDFNGQKSGGAGALDLIHTTERLQKNWFHLYMRQPSRFHPTVIMPSYWPGGQAIRKEVLNGDTDQQIEALWTYLSDGQRAKNPKGLSRQSRELRVADETVMCRGRGPASYRGIGVGYPERISLVFDSREMNLRHLWKGEFASVNHGSFQLRGDNRITFPEGIPFHRLTDMDASWPYKGKTNYTFPHDHGYQYRGYRLDKEKRPTFLYHYGDISVEDYFEDHLDENGKAYFNRTMTFNTTGPQKKFYFRVASGKKITSGKDDWQIDSLNLRVVGKISGKIRDGDSKELLVPITLPAGKTTLHLEYRW